MGKKKFLGVAGEAVKPSRVCDQLGDIPTPGTETWRKGTAEPARGTGEDENSVCLATASVMLPLGSAHTFLLGTVSAPSPLSARGLPVFVSGRWDIYSAQRWHHSHAPQQRQHNKICESQDKLSPSRHEQARLSGSF
ncbi:hypothetical protein HL42_1186 [Trichophyton rubrum]|nr:hypothetical protein HL42_1186 [Trichophyton rubrum]